MTANPPHPVDLHVGTRVRLRRMQLGISQETLGEGLGLTFQQIQKYEKGKNRIGASRLAAIAVLLGTDHNFFFEQAAGGGYAAGDSAMDRFLASREGHMIAQGFDRIADPRLRGAIARLVRDAGAEPGDKQQ